AIRGVGKALMQYVDNIEIFGMYDGYRGLIENDYKFMEPNDFSGIIALHEPGGVEAECGKNGGAPVWRYLVRHHAKSLVLWLMDGANIPHSAQKSNMETKKNGKISV
ncbi:MAG: hypothetical protein IKB22_03945, partial [Lentisphaeria bacterium]|nr:hypothetical protein [Lentisphaeria bacterium]